MSVRQRKQRGCRFIVIINLFKTFFLIGQRFLHKNKVVLSFLVKVLVYKDDNGNFTTGNFKNVVD